MSTRKGYFVQARRTKSGVRYRAFVWNPVTGRREPVVNTADGSKTFH